MMLGLCIMGFLVFSAAASILVWGALAVAKQADEQLRGMEHRLMAKHAAEPGLTGTVLASGDD